MILNIKNLPTQKQHILAPLFILVTATICFIFDDQISHIFIYQRDAIIAQEYWRLITGHLFHTNYAHFLLNTLAIVLLWALHGQFYSIRNYISLMAYCAIIISLAIYLTDLDMTTYVGLSGVLHALFIWGALKDIQHHDKTGYFLLFGAIMKVGHEQIFGANEDIATLIEANVAIDAHLWGTIAGATFFVLTWLIARKKE